MAAHPSTTQFNEQSSPKPADLTTVEQLERRNTLLQAELDRIREAASHDLQNLQADVVAKNREIGRLKAEITKSAEDTPEASDAKALLRLWRDCYRRGDKRVDVSLESDRGKAMLRAIKKRGADRVRKAILGVEFDDWAMGHTSKQDRPYNDIAKHVLKDSDRFEHFEKLFDERHPEGARPQASPQAELDREPESEERQFVRFVYGDKCELPYLPASKEPKRRPPGPGAPIDRVLSALRATGYEAHDNRPDQWSAQCPAHDDRSPSLAVHRKPDGTVLLHCFAGCLTEDVLAAVGLEWRDLWDGSERDTGALDAPHREGPVIPPHLVHAMQQIILRNERQAV